MLASCLAPACIAQLVPCLHPLRSDISKFLPHDTVTTESINMSWDSKHSWAVWLSIALFLKEHHILCQMKYHMNDDTQTLHLIYNGRHHCRRYTHHTHTHTHRAVLSTWRKVLTAVTPSLLTINKVMCRGHIEWLNFQSYRKKRTGQYRYFCIGSVDSF